MATEELRIRFRRESHIPLYLQIKRGIRDALLDAPSDRELVLPPQRELAQRLGVSRNTVSMAYAELEREGLVTSRVGRGTIVVGAATESASFSKQGMLRKALDQGLDEALSLGVTLEEYIDAARTFLDEKAGQLGKVRLVCVDDRRERLECLADRLATLSGIVVGRELLAGPVPKGEALARLRGAEVVVAWFHHVAGLKAALAGATARIVGVNVSPDFSTVASIARIPEGARVALVAASDDIHNEMAGTLVKVGVPPECMVRLSPDQSGGGLPEGVEVVVAAPGHTHALAVAGGRVVEFRHAVDDRSMRSVRAAVQEARERRGREAAAAGPGRGRRKRRDGRRAKARA
ncbi:MAG: GntR family transcriptional regulator [Planctomycetota bacterium]|jgi:GntR family transcriptional regulator